MPRKPRPGSSKSQKASDVVTSIQYPATRKNIPPAGLEAQGVLREAPRIRYEYNPHLPPILRFSNSAVEVDRLPELLAIARRRALSSDEAKVLAEALGRQEPWLEWSGKREKPWFEVDPLALHMHERVSTQAILRVLAREDIERSLFADPQQEYAQAVQFYKYDVDWANRMILGDSLQVMASLVRREDLAGRVQAIYFDPPYGIRFKSNFQPQLGQRDVKDREQDLTREPEMVKAYRDTWTLGVHSYLAYLRDRLAMAKELLTNTGSIFVQISDENLHRVRCLMDEVFAAENQVVTLVVKKKGNQKGGTLEPINDYLLWYAKDKTKVKIRPLFVTKFGADSIPDDYDKLEFPNGELRTPTEDDAAHLLELMAKGTEVIYSDQLTSGGEFRTQLYPIIYEGEEFRPAPNNSWKHNEADMNRVVDAERMLRGKDQIRFRKRLSDFGCVALTNLWTDVAGAKDKIYVVQTNTKVVERCLLMTTDPGDLVLDPTCGSGTTAFVAEQWGRRWITCDSSRVALALAKHRLLTAKFDFQQLRALNAEDVSRNPKGTWLTDPTCKIPGKVTFECKTVPHITLKSIAQNTSLDPIFDNHRQVLADALTRLNIEVAKVDGRLRELLVQKLIRKHREQGASAVTVGDTRRWLLPDTPPNLIRSVPAKKPLKGVTPKQAETYRKAIPKGSWKEWEAPFDADPDWPKSLQDVLAVYRSSWRAKMDEVNTCISANAETEELVDKVEPVKGVVRVSGPFTMEGVIAVEDGPESPIGGAPDELDTFDGELAVANAEAHLDKILRLLRASGVDFPGNRTMKFDRLDALTGAALIHAEGEWINGDNKSRRVAVSVGPEVGNVTALQVEDVIRDANRKGYDDVVFAGFGFDAPAQDAVETTSHPKLRLHMALIRPDVAMGDLLKVQPGSQLFTVFSAPRVKGPTQQPDGDFTVEVEGMDVYDPVSNTLFPTDKERIAAWFLDTDYDGRTFCICQAFFPDKNKWAKLAKALEDAEVVDEDAFDSLSGLTSLPFPRPDRLGKGEKWRIAVKLINPRGNEGLRVLTQN
jgi:adenine-specific DNA-methyltransferase